ncbi:MAG: serine/threonine protein kinase [Ktedonobacteraceae bacterium]|nr:serine/threonine protein kinase [Ktedonobacteraceae bacterium]
MADVCLAFDEQENNEVAIKVLRPDQLDTKALSRFRKEASLIAGWQHPNIIHIYGEVELDVLPNGRGTVLPYIVMEHIQGGNLKERLTPDQPYPFSKVVTLFTQVCSAVQYAHEHGIIHRDIKPENILFRQLPGSSEDVVLSDFGMAVALSATHHTFSHGGTLS